MIFDSERRSGLAAATAAAILAFGVTGTARSADLDAGRKTFESVCAACHGNSGRPDPGNAAVKALGRQPADLSDPLFNSREPASDWNIVVTHGGPALGLSAVMPPQGAALSPEAIRDVVAYAKTLAPGSDRYPPGELNFFLPVRTKKAFPEDEVVWKGRVTVRDGENVWRNVLELEKRFGRRSMGVVEVIHEDDGVDREITKVEAGAKTVLHWNVDRQSILSGALIVAVPTDSEESEEVIPYLAYGKRLAGQATFQSSARVIVPVDETDAGEVELAGVVHYQWMQKARAAFPALEVTASVPFDADGGDSVQWTVLPQFRLGLTKGGHVALAFGVEIPLSDQSWDTRYHMNVLWDFADGSLFMGW